MTHVLIRNVVSRFSSLLSSGPSRPQGISAIVRTRDSELWLEPCLSSVEPFVEEILIVDNGSKDGTLKIAESFRQQFSEKIRFFSVPALDLTAQSEFAFHHTKYHWVLKWDSDFVAHTCGALSLAHLRAFLLGLNDRMHYYVQLPMVELSPDLYHQLRALPIRRDGFALTYSPRLHFVWNSHTLTHEQLPGYYHAFQKRKVIELRTGVEAPKIPLNYRVIAWDKTCFFHLNIKSPEQRLLRHFNQQWLEEKQTISLRDYVKKRLNEDFGGESFAAASRRLMQAYAQDLIDFEPEKFGGYPDLLKKFLKT